MRSLMSHRRLLTGIVAGLVLAGLFLLKPGLIRSKEEKEKGPDPAAVKRTRETVHMLDDLYKSAVVHITKTYVRAQEKTPAARAAKLIFKDMAAKGHHYARLLDATGEPLNSANAPKTDFEKRAVAKIKSGKPYFEELGTRAGKPVLRAATVVPVVMNQCINCHPGHKLNDVLGAIVYEVPIK